MISNETKQTVATSGNGIRSVANFHISKETEARIMISLADKIYANKTRACIREIINNCADVHIQVNKPISDIIFTLPTFDDSNIKFRDFGTGLTEEEITNTYCVFGYSTKRNSNEYNGLLGYGNKVFMAVSDSCTVTSWINGEKSIYQCIKGDTSTLPTILLLSRTPSDEPQGLEVSIPIKNSDLYSFHEEAANYFKYWAVLPQILNMNEEYKEKLENFRKLPASLSGDGWEVRAKSDYTATGVALMAGVGYPIDWNKISTSLPLNSQTRCLFELLQSNDVILKFGMAEVQFVDSREALEYSDLTINALTAKINDIFVKIKNAVQDKFTNATNIWEAKKIYNSIFGSGLPIDTEDGGVNIDNIKILNGNLRQLEESLKGQLTWNGVVISDASFRHINKFDNNDSPATINDSNHQPYRPVMTTYRPKSGKLKTNKCKYENYNGITASDYVAVVINDTNKKSGVAMVARYLCFCDDIQDNHDYKTVHMLNFTTPEMKDLFYKEYNFDTVPVIKMSEIITSAKSWYNANKGTRNSSGGGVTIKHIQYLDLVSETVEESDVSFKDIEENVYYLYQATGRRTKNKVVVSGAAGCRYNKYKSDVLSALKTINDKFDLDIDKVYIVGATTKNSVWFNKAVANKEWINVVDYVKEQLPNINAQELVNDTVENDVVDVDVVPQLISELGDTHIISNLCKTALGIEQKTESKNMVSALSTLEIWSGISNSITPNVDLEKMKEEIGHLYPYITWSNLRYNSYFDEDTKKKFVRYVRSMDCYIELNPEFKEEFKSEVEAVAA